VPIPNTPSTTSLDEMSMVPTESGPIDIVNPTRPTTRMSGEWEEPHPGQRYSNYVKGSGNACCGASVHRGNGVHGAGTAAKGYSPYPIRGLGSGYRRLSRTRLRTSLRPLKISTTLMEDGRKRSMTANSLQSNASSALPLIEPPMYQSLPGEYAASPLAIDPVFETDSEKGLDGLAGDAMDTTTPSELSSPRLSMIDFSGHLSAAFEHTKDYEPACLEPIVFSHDPSVVETASPEEDRYGWECELERKFCPPDTFQYRRAGGAKRSLLHRVFKLSSKATS